MNYGKVPPQNLEFENAILGICMLEKFAFATANQFLFKEAFYKFGNECIYEALCTLFDNNKPIDIITVVQQLRESGKLEDVGGAYAVTVLTNNVKSDAHLEDWCKKILELYMKREGIRISGELMNNCYSDETDAFEVMNATDNQIIDLQEVVLRGQIADLSTYTAQVYDEYEKVKQTGVLGIKTGIQAYDDVMCGLVSPDLVIIAARPGAGKTAFALSITKNITYDQDIPGAWFSFEMKGSQLVRRLASMITGINHELIRHGNIHPNLEQLFMDTLHNISTKPLFIEDKSNMNIRELRSRAIVLKRKFDIQYIVVDYLQMMDGIDSANKNRNDIVGEISRGLKNLAKELDINVTALSQLSRAVEGRSDKMPQLSDLRESGSIEQDADSVLFLMRPDYYGITNEYTIDGQEYAAKDLTLGIAGKNRHGATKNIAMQFNGPTMTISSHSQGTHVGYSTPIKNISQSNNNELSRNVSSDYGWPTIDEKDLF